MDRQAADGDDGEFVGSVALVGVADVQLAAVFYGVGVAEIRIRGGDARGASTNGGANEEDAAEFGLFR